ncbi:TolC family protein [Campylobacter gastrosuis]|uniref:TolC family protein n=1 Tax=Campylobacter gastrosuis TaxID=2974576 RepID=A0ABT7HR81_9BACT|nr:TolC family protein [Campylobacter gastrosuis]MDL0089368.1 TolC family protein [Campylobacter gastrosuis]
MKKIVSASILAALSIASANAEGFNYRIFVGTFGEGRSDTSVNKVAQKLQNDIEGIANLIEVDSYISDKKEKVLFIDTKPISRAEADSLLAKVKQIKGHSDSFMKLKTEQDYLIVTENQKARASGKMAPLNIEQVLAGDEVPEMPKQDPVVPASETQATGNALTLESVVKSILSENPNIKQAEFTYLQVGKDLNIAKNAYYPTLDASGYVGYEKKRLDDGVSTRTGDGRISGANLTLTENLYNGGADKHRINSQSARLDSTAYTLAQTADRLVLQAVNAYLELIKTKKILDIEADSVKSHEQIYNQIKDRAQAGFGVASEERQAGSRYTLAQSNLIAAENNYEDAISTFEKLYGRRVTAADLVMPEFGLALPNSEKEVYDKAMLCNPSLLVQRANIAMAESVVKEKDAPFRPKLDLEVSGNYEHTNVLYDNYEEATFDTLLRLRYNLYNKGTDKLEKEKSQLATSAEQQTLDVLTRDLTESLKFSWQNYTLEQKKMAYLNEHVEFAKATLDSYQDEFRIGRRDLINLLDAENEYNTALKEIINTETALLYAKYRLLDNMGMISDSFEPGFAKKYIQGACSIANDLR